jgi:hypothetical protein
MIHTHVHPLSFQMPATDDAVLVIVITLVIAILVAMGWP